ncbi:hypothetical protein Q6A86_09030, partial [Aliarcobacter skirrowii]|uniref:hypothetical protein n=1 Tax=Aliarcobacter skirrowii TaxID=28200 RepID=UPI0029B9FA38
IDKIDIVLFNFSKNHIMKMIDKLIDNNISFPLMTDHASTLFLNESSESNNIKIVERSKYKHSWIHCKFSLKERLFSLLGDETESLFYILPELKNKLQLRFVNPSGTSGEKKMEYFDIFDCISPSFARDGSTIYVARRLLILNDEEKKQNQSMKVNRRTKGFSKSVLKEVLSRIGEDKVFPIYTHLGYIDIEERKTPYFETENLDQLHKVTFGKDKDRQVWFTKALTLYDYSLILQTVAKRVLRYKDIIFIRKYRDSVINLMLPINKNQLNGLTFYVDSFDKTNIIYNYKKIIDLSYNYEYNTNRKIVTIVGVGNNYPIIEKNYIINAENKNIKIKLDKNLNYDGVSYLKVVSCSRNIKFGLLLKTKLGNYFFGDYDIGKNISDNIIAKSYFKLKNPKKRVEYFSFSELDWIDKESISLPSKDLFEIEILHNAISKYDSILLNELSFIRQSSI